MTITTEQKLEAATLTLEAFGKNIIPFGNFGAALLALSTAAKEIENLTGVVEALELMVHLPSAAGTAMHRRAVEALARFKELVG